MLLPCFIFWDFSPNRISKQIFRGNTSKITQNRTNFEWFLENFSLQAWSGIMQKAKRLRKDAIEQTVCRCNKRRVTWSVKSHMKEENTRKTNYSSYKKLFQTRNRSGYATMFGLGAFLFISLAYIDAFTVTVRLCHCMVSAWCIKLGNAAFINQIKDLNLMKNLFWSRKKKHDFRALYAQSSRLLWQKIENKL